MEKRSVRREHFRVGVGTAFKIVKKARWFSVNSKTHPIIQEKSLTPNEELIKNINININFFKKHNLKKSDLEKLCLTVLKPYISFKDIYIHNKFHKKEEKMNHRLNQTRKILNHKKK
uniref:Uncharacterized protein n=1 Tax=Cacopsylla melanoneura TaxID=428564 RepID=A0A8D8WQ80_9HEMI